MPPPALVRNIFLREEGNYRWSAVAGLPQYSKLEMFLSHLAIPALAALSTIRFPRPLSRTVSASFGDNQICASQTYRCFLCQNGIKSSRYTVCQCLYFSAGPQICIGFFYDSAEQTLCNSSFTCPIATSTTPIPLDSPAFASNSGAPSLTHAVLAVSHQRSQCCLRRCHCPLSQRHPPLRTIP